MILSGMVFMLLAALPSQLVGSTAEGELERAVIGQVNHARAGQGLAPLSRNGNLHAAAQWMAEDLASRGRLDHTDSRGRSMDERLPVFGYFNAEIMAENIAQGADRPDTVVQEWLHSKGHRANLLHPELRQVGVGHARNAAGMDFWVLDLGTSFRN